MSLYKIFCGVSLTLFIIFTLVSFLFFSVTADQLCLDDSIRIFENCGYIKYVVIFVVVIGLSSVVGVLSGYSFYPKVSLLSYFSILIISVAIVVYALNEL